MKLENYSIPTGYYDQLHMYLYDVNMRLYKDIEVGINATGTINIKLEKSITYYLKICHDVSKDTYVGNYAFSVKYVYDDVSNSINGAKEVAVNTTHSNSLDGNGDVDWFKMNIATSGRYKLSCTNHNINCGYYDKLHIYLFDIYEHTLVDFEIDENATVEKEIDLEAGNVYYIKLDYDDNNKTGNYAFSLTLNGYTPTEPTDPPVDPGETPTQKTLTSLSIATAPEKTVYEVGERISLTGLKVIAHYSNGTAAYVNGYSISGDDFSSAGEKTIVVTYTENGISKSCRFNVTVNASDSSDPPGASNGSGSFVDYLLLIVEFFKNVISFLVDLIMAVV